MVERKRRLDLNDRKQILEEDANEFLDQLEKSIIANSDSASCKTLRSPHFLEGLENDSKSIQKRVKLLKAMCDGGFVRFIAINFPFLLTVLWKITGRI